MNGRVAQRRIHRRHRWRSANGAPGRGADGLRRGVRALAGRDVAGGAAAVVGRDCLARARRRRATGAAAVVVDGLNLDAVDVLRLTQHPPGWSEVARALDAGAPEDTP